uniref:Fucolectin tachylectin-4 pentraxin-1 domain-containing protein n=1 Tax=Magallana gigas TaxID=29159 RepID=A0A8W8NII6_MAGGI
MRNMSYNHCIFCVAGLLVVYAYDDLSHSKIATQSHTYTGVGYGATNAVDGNITTCTRTKDIGPNSPDKTVWWKVDFGEIINVFRINILFKNYNGYDIRQRGRIAGFSLLVSKTGDIHGATLCYKAGPQLPPLNFTSICSESGRYVIFYNERLDGVTYPEGYEVINVLTELCEVTVQGCNNASVYGTDCDTPCPTTCKDNTCHIQSGSCFKCKPGWSGVKCNTKCKEGLYGDNCTQQCTGHCKDGAACNHVTGLCDGGCDA